MNSPTSELKKILAAIDSRDEKTFAALVDLKPLMDVGYDEATDVLAENCAKFHELYPKDLFFKFGSRILRFYNDKFRGVHLGLINKIIAAYFDGSFRDAKNFSETPIKFLAAELKNLLDAIHADFGDENISGNSATLNVKMVGDNSEYGKMIGTLNFVLEFAKRGDEVKTLGGKKFDATSSNWRLVKIKNVEELVPPILDIAETYWPSSWDLGIKI
ncbi:MAG: hypothetical protein IJ685_11830 [Selenomonadaceae bacterium]|nr:hypothetical protein [Selenomonadaceae bacterium]